MAQRLRGRATAAVAAGLAAAYVALTAGPALADSVRNQEWWLTTLHVTKAWDSSRGAGVTVAVLGNGVNPGQADLAGSVTTGPDYTDSGEVPGTTFWGAQGTAVASLIAGHGHGPGGANGIIGVAPQAKILSIRVTLEPNDPLLAQPAVVSRLPGAIAQGIRYAVAHGAQVIELPLDPAALAGGTVAGGSTAESQAVASALSKGVVLVAPAGDEGGAADTTNYPAAYPDVISVGAFSQDFTKAPFTIHKPYVTLTGPGVNVIAPTGLTGYAPFSSTAAASAVVAGTAALIKAQFPTLTPAQVSSALTTSTGFHPPGGRANGSGAGTVDTEAALLAAAKINATPTSSPSAKASPLQPPAAPKVKAKPTTTLWEAVRYPVIGLAAILLIALLVLIVSRRRQRRARDARLAPVRAAAQSPRRQQMANGVPGPGDLAGQEPSAPAFPAAAFPGDPFPDSAFPDEPLAGHPFADQQFADQRFGARAFADQPFPGRAVEAQPFDAQPFDAQPFQAQPFDAQPFDAQSFDAQPSEAQAYADQPFADRAFEAQPFTDRPFQDRPFQDRPAAGAPAGRGTSAGAASAGRPLPGSAPADVPLPARNGADGHGHRRRHGPDSPVPDSSAPDTAADGPGFDATAYINAAFEAAANGGTPDEPASPASPPSRAPGSASRAPRTPRITGRPPWEPAVKPDGELPWMSTPAPRPVTSRAIPPRRPFPHPGAGPAEEVAAGDFPAGGFPAADFPADFADTGFASDAPASDFGRGGGADFPAGDFPAGDFPAGDFPAGDFPAGDFPAGDFPASGFPRGGRADFPAGDFPAAGGAPGRRAADDGPGRGPVGGAAADSAANSGTPLRRSTTDSGLPVRQPKPATGGTAGRRAQFPSPARPSARPGEPLFDPFDPDLPENGPRPKYVWNPADPTEAFPKVASSEPPAEDNGTAGEAWRGER